MFKINFIRDTHEKNISKKHKTITNKSITFYITKLPFFFTMKHGVNSKKHPNFVILKKKITLTNFTNF